MIAFLIAGMGGLHDGVNCAYIGGLIGLVKRRGRGTPDGLRRRRWSQARLFGVVAVGALAVLARLRHLIFESITANVNGLAASWPHRPFAMEHPLPLSSSSTASRPPWLLTYWPWLIGGRLRPVSSIAVRHLDRLVGAVAGADPAAGVPDVHKLDVLGRHRRRSARCRCGCTTSASAIPTPTTTRSAR